MIKEQCGICLHTITNPIGNECYLEQIDEGLKNIHIEKRERNKIIQKIHVRLPDTLNETECICCRNENVNICSYCLLQIAKSVVAKSKLPRDAIEYLHVRFDYEKPVSF